MTLLQAIQTANTNAGINAFSFANIQEFQSFMDSFGFTTYPEHIVVPYQFNGSRENGRNNVVVPLQGWVVRRIPEDTNDYRTADIETLYMAPMRVLAIKFINSLLDTTVIDPEVEKVTWTVRPEYMFLSSHVFGVGYTVNLPILESVCSS